MQKSKLALIDEYDMKEEVESQALHFMDDLKVLKNHSEVNGRKHWFIFIMGTTKSTECQVHFWRLATDKKKELPVCVVNGTEYGSTVLADDEEKLQQIFKTSQKVLEAREVVVDNQKQAICVCLDNNDILKSVDSSNIMCRMGGGKDCNALTIRLGYEILMFNSKHLMIVKDLADAIKNQVESKHEIPADVKKCFLSEGDGYADDFCKKDVFERDPGKLKKMIAQKTKEARMRFGSLDLDGKIEVAQK
jgi:hypothetical protein